jgi:hypothetical protein
MKQNNLLIKLAWFYELFLTIIVCCLSYYLYIEELDNSDKILIAAVCIIILLTNLTKIPIASALIFSETLFYRFLFLFTLILLSIVSFETYVQVFELYVVNYNLKLPEILNNNLIFLIFSFVCSVTGVLIALSGLFIERLEHNKLIKEYYKKN